MEEDIEDIRNKIEDFMEKYNVSVKVETSCGYTVYGKIAEPKARISIYS